MIKPLDKDHETLEKLKDSDFQKKVKRDKYWLKGYKAAKNGKHKYEDNPYPLDEKIRSLLRKRTLWMAGFERREDETKWKRLEEMKKLSKEKRHKHKEHKHKRHHK